MISTVESYHDRETMIVGGDFNLVMNPEIDREDSDFNHYKGMEIIKEFMEWAEIKDIWGFRYSKKVIHMVQRWMRRNKNLASRIDMLLVSV